MDTYNRDAVGRFAKDYSGAAGPQASVSVSAPSATRTLPTCEQLMAAVDMPPQFRYAKALLTGDLHRELMYRDRLTTRSRTQAEAYVWCLQSGLTPESFHDAEVQRGLSWVNDYAALTAAD